MEEVRSQTNVDELVKIATQIRRDIIRMVTGAGNGHPGGALGCADYFTALYFKIMKHNKSFNMNGIGEDLFFLSNGHISAVWYSTLARAGYFPVSELATHRKINSRLQGHPTTEEDLPGIRVASGSLGQGLSVAIGAARAKVLNNDDRLVYCLMGDGEQQEGQIWEAAMYAAHAQVDNIIATVDLNGQQIDGPVNEVLSLKDIKAKYESFGWETLEMDGNVMEEVVETLEQARNLCGNKKPVVILMKTEMGYPIDFMVGTHKWHGVAPDEEQAEKALTQLDETIGDF